MLFSALVTNTSMKTGSAEYQRTTSLSSTTATARNMTTPSVAARWTGMLRHQGVAPSGARRATINAAHVTGIQSQALAMAGINASDHEIGRSAAAAIWRFCSALSN